MNKKHTKDTSYQVWLESMNAVVYGPKGVLTERVCVVLGEKKMMDFLTPSDFDYFHRIAMAHRESDSNQV